MAGLAVASRGADSRGHWFGRLDRLGGLLGDRSMFGLGCLRAPTVCGTMFATTVCATMLCAIDGFFEAFRRNVAMYAEAAHKFGRAVVGVAEFQASATLGNNRGFSFWFHGHRESLLLRGHRKWTWPLPFGAGAQSSVATYYRHGAYDGP